ncbi:MAG: 50S ribosomal protein L13 [Natrialbaceae archaeon]|nr:50S ribosomal protein L13 [Natrialbaceae archaeon]
MSATQYDPDVVIDAGNCILGRVASMVATRALEGARLAVVNAEDAVVTGERTAVFEEYQGALSQGSDQGPATAKRPDTILKQSIRGMLPHKRQRGRDALENVRVYVGNPFEDDDVPSEVLEGTTLDRLSNIRFVHLHEIAEQLGAKVTW